MDKNTERLFEINRRKAEIRQALTDGKVENLEEIEQELRDLETESQNIEKRMKLIDGLKDIEKPNEKGNEKMKNRTFGVETVEYRNAYLKKLMGKELDEMEQRTVLSANAPIPTMTMNKVVEKLEQTNSLFNKISVSYIEGNVSFSVADAKNDASFKAEGTDGTPADDTTITVSLTGHELIKLVELSAKVEAMSIDAFETYIVDEIGRKMSIAIINAILNGTGTNEPTGLLKAGIITNSGTFTKAGMKYKDLMTMLAKLPTMYHTNATVIMPRKLFFEEVLGMETTTGEPVVVQNPQSPMLFNIVGYPVEINDYMPADTIIFGDLSYYKLNFAKTPEISSDKSAGFKSGKTIYRGLAIVDGKPALAEAFVKYTRATA